MKRRYGMRRRRYTRRKRRFFKRRTKTYGDQIMNAKIIIKEEATAYSPAGEDYRQVDI